MLDTSTVYLIFAMAIFLFVAIIMVHQHGNSEIVRRKNNEATDYIGRINLKLENVESEIVDLQLKIDELDEEIESLKGEM